ncbi:hypothetical protein [Nocardia cyriacigeorgica]|uniref:Small hydrophilic protein n=1 Tax=Nocardia cyriacigeorgica TaxID=135487 RepID=A0A5R8P076_9NOCA|nr:hypothetical protein [Nocardia cyriacigeorgica]TLF82532.1 hypothetical protein FEK34_01970 [Nocardia cyriacigeorgica]
MRTFPALSAAIAVMGVGVATAVLVGPAGTAEETPTKVYELNAQPAPSPPSSGPATQAPQPASPPSPGQHTYNPGPPEPDNGDDGYEGSDEDE